MNAEHLPPPESQEKTETVDGPGHLAVTQVQLWMVPPDTPSLNTAPDIPSVEPCRQSLAITFLLSPPSSPPLLWALQTHIAARSSPHFTHCVHLALRQVSCKAANRFLVQTSSIVHLARNNACMCPEHFSHNTEIHACWAIISEQRSHAWTLISGSLKPGLNGIILLSSNFLCHFLAHVDDRLEGSTVKGNVFLFVLFGALHAL